MHTGCKLDGKKNCVKSVNLFHMFFQRRNKYYSCLTAKTQISAFHQRFGGTDSGPVSVVHWTVGSVAAVLHRKRCGLSG